jgi:signal transduction histidine kinase
MALPKLLLFLVLLALVPLTLLGITAYTVATGSLDSVEHQHVNEALASTNRAFASIRGGLTRIASGYADSDALHDGVAQGTASDEWYRANFGPESSFSVSVMHNVPVVGIWDRAGKLLYNVGPLDDVAQGLRAETAAGDNTRSITFPTWNAIYIVALAPIRTSQGTDPVGSLLLARPLVQADVDQIKELTGYDVALYRDLQPIAATDDGMLHLDTAELDRARMGLPVMDYHANPAMGIAYLPLQNENGDNLATLVVMQPRGAIIEAQNAIGGALAFWFILCAALALVVALLLHNAIVRPLTAMADTADKIASGDLSRRVSTSSSMQELGRLAQAFNRMAEGISTRMAELESARSRLQALDEQRLTLLNSITESLRVPVEQVRTHSQLLTMQMHGTLNDAQLRSLLTIRRAASTQEVLLSDLLDFAQAQKKRLRMAIGRVHLGEVVRNAYTAVKERYLEKQITFQSDIPGDLPQILGDPVRMEQVLDRLLGWACNLSLPNGRVQLSAVAGRSDVQICISDTSPGLSSDDKSRIFDLFYYPVRDEHENGNGTRPDTGLGLAFVKTLIEQQNGKINLEVQPGRGNTFTFTIPTG